MAVLKLFPTLRSTAFHGAIDRDLLVVARAIRAVGEILLGDDGLNFFRDTFNLNALYFCQSSSGEGNSSRAISASMAPAFAVL
jgi:hypothetical protein